MFNSQKTISPYFVKKKKKKKKKKKLYLFHQHLYLLKNI